MGAWMAAGDNAIVDTVINQQVIKAAGDLGRVLTGAMKAVRVISPPIRDPNTGAEIAPMVTVPDHETRLDAVKQTGDLAAALRAKGGGVNIVNAFGVPGGNGNGGSDIKSFEQRLRILREKRGLRSDDSTADIMDAEIVEDDAEDDEVSDSGDTDTEPDKVDGDGGN
jgi:hypothetical protein